MPKTLIILAHPNISQSTVHKHWADAALPKYCVRLN